MSDVAEHHAEHEDVGQCGEQGRVDVGVGHSAVEVDHRSEGAPGGAAFRELGRGVDPPRGGQRDRGRADRGEGLGEPVDGSERAPTRQRGDVAPPHGGLRDLGQLGLAREQVGGPAPGEVVEVRGDARESGLCRATLAAAGGRPAVRRGE